MTQTTSKFFRHAGFVYFVPFIISIIIGQQAFSQTDSRGQVLLASLNSDEIATASGNSTGSNVIFPEILKGNEEQAIEYIQGFSEKRRNYLLSMYNRGKKLLPQAGEILKNHGLPEELKVLLALESAYNPNARSKAGAVGYWQFMDNVAREYGMKIAQIKAEKKRIKGRHTRVKQLKTRDDRKNFVKSTTAAARYLCDRRRNLNDNWLLMVASYNCGIGNVWNAMEKTGLESPTFWDVKDYLPSETQGYVMNFITLNVIFANYDNFLNNKLIFKEEKIAFPVKYDELPFNDDINSSTSRLH